MSKLRSTLSGFLLAGQVLAGVSVVGGGWQAISSSREGYSQKVMDGMSFPPDAIAKFIEIGNIGSSTLNSEDKGWKKKLENIRYITKYGANEIMETGGGLYHLQKNVKESALSTLLAGLSTMGLYFLLAELFVILRIGDRDTKSSAWRKKIARRIGLGKSQLDTASVEDIEQAIQTSGLTREEAVKLIAEAIH